MQTGAEKKDILFVDDEPNILNGIRHALYNKNKNWGMHFAESGEEALDIIRKNKIDVIVTDMRMPQMDGAKLLQRVKMESPETIRIILSGQSDLAMVMRIVNIAHQFLAKPCNAKHLEEIITRSCKLQDILKHADLRNVVGIIENLPTQPKSHQELTQALSDPNVTSEQIASIIEKDIAMSAKILQLSNSAFFGLPHKTTNILRAVNYVGFETLKNLTLGIGVFDSFESNHKMDEKFLAELQENSIMCAHLAKRIMEDPEKGKDAFLAGILHNIGKLVLMSYFTDRYQKVLKQASETKHEVHFIEKNTFGVTNAEIGGFLLGIWGIPYPIVEAVTFQYNPMLVQVNELGIIDALYIASRLIKDPQNAHYINKEYLKQRGVESKLAEWQKLAIDIQKEMKN